jgi:DNA polymerase/3'-5' exonuclease PolX
MAFKFDPNSTKNQGRWRLRDPNDFIKNKYITRKLKTGISYILGILKDNKENKYTVQAIRFDKNIWSEKEAKIWWNENKYKYVKTWTQKDWDKLKEESSSDEESSSSSDEESSSSEEEEKEKEKEEKRIDIKQGIKLAKEISKILKIKFVNVNKITIDTEFIKDIIFPVGSIRRNKLMIKDIDLILTKQIYKNDLKNIKDFTNFSGGEKRIDFDYKGTRINLFVFLNKDTFGSALLHSTGPRIYNITIRRKLKKMGWKLSQNGLIDEKGNLIITRTERELQDKIGVKNRLPTERDLY